MHTSWSVWVQLRMRRVDATEAESPHPQHHQPLRFRPSVSNSFVRGFAARHSMAASRPERFGERRSLKPSDDNANYPLSLLKDTFLFGPTFRIATSPALLSVPRNNRFRYSAVACSCVYIIEPLFRRRYKGNWVLITTSIYKPGVLTVIRLIIGHVIGLY
jgi:hypothetical protein